MCDCRSGIRHRRCLLFCLPGFSVKSDSLATPCSLVTICDCLQHMFAQHELCLLFSRLACSITGLNQHKPSFAVASVHQTTSKTSHFPVTMLSRCSLPAAAKLQREKLESLLLHQIMISPAITYRIATAEGGVDLVPGWRQKLPCSSHIHMSASILT